MLVPYEDARFAPGQVWKVAGLPADARLVVLRVEQAREGAIIVHVAVEGIALEGLEEESTRIGHLPFARAAVDGSVTDLVGTVEPSAFEEGYRLWREAFEAGTGGIFTVSVAEVVRGLIGSAAE